MSPEHKGKTAGVTSSRQRHRNSPDTEMDREESPEPTEVEYSYLDIGPTGPRTWVLVIGALVVALAFAAAFYGLYIINKSASPTLSPDAAEPTAVTERHDAAASSAIPPLTAPTPTAGITATTEPPTYTVQQGDTLIAIAQRFNVSVNDLTSLNQLGSETIFPDQVLLVPPTVTPWPDTGPFSHIVAQGESLISIAALYSVTVEEVKTLNALTSDTIFADQKILIPAGGIRPPTPTPYVEEDVIVQTAPSTPTTTTVQAWQPSMLAGDLASGYPLTLEGERFALHYQPDTPVARAPDQAAALVASALSHIEDKLYVGLEDRFDVYTAGSPFAADDMALRGKSVSSQRRVFFLFDDTGTPNERRYIVTHALTHLVAWHTIGRPSSAMLDQGLAVYIGVEAMEAAGFVPLPHFCAAYQQADPRPSLSESRAYSGHIRDLGRHFTAGCFVGYLIEEYGIDAFKQLFTNGDYWGIYGRTLAKLEANWIQSLEPVGQELPFSPADLLASAADVDDAYDRLFADFGGTPSQMAAYRQLDQARIAMLQGRFEEARGHLDAFEELLKGE